MAAEEVQTAADLQEGQSGLEEGDPSVPPPPEPLGLGPIILVTKDDKSRVTGDC